MFLGILFSSPPERQSKTLSSCVLTKRYQSRCEAHWNPGWLLWRHNPVELIQAPEDGNVAQVADNSRSCLQLELIRVSRGHSLESDKVVRLQPCEAGVQYGSVACRVDTQTTGQSLDRAYHWSSLRSAISGLAIASAMGVNRTDALHSGCKEQLVRLGAKSLDKADCKRTDTGRARDPN